MYSERCPCDGDEAHTKKHDMHEHYKVDRFFGSVTGPHCKELVMGKGSVTESPPRHSRALQPSQKAQLEGNVDARLRSQFACSSISDVADTPLRHPHPVLQALGCRMPPMRHACPTYP